MEFGVVGGELDILTNEHNQTLQGSWNITALATLATSTHAPAQSA